MTLPWLAGVVEVDYDFFVFETELFQGDVSSMGEGTSVVSVERDSWLDALVLSIGRVVGVTGHVEKCVYLYVCVYVCVC